MKNLKETILGKLLGKKPSATVAKERLIAQSRQQLRLVDGNLKEPEAKNDRKAA
jgi:hypothetical protein